MKTDVGAAYIPMPKGSGFTPHLDKNPRPVLRTLDRDRGADA